MGMVAVKCPSCGADIQLDDSREFGFCTYCGTKVVQEKIVVEHRGEISIDNSESLKNLITLARRAKSFGEYDKAKGLYEEVLLKNPSSCEASFYSYFLEYMNGYLVSSYEKIDKLNDRIDFSLELLKASASEIADTEKVLSDISDDLSRYVESQIKKTDEYKSNSEKYYSVVTGYNRILYRYGNKVLETFGDGYGKKVSVTVWLKAINNSIAYVKNVGLIENYVRKEAELINTYTKKIKKLDPEKNVPSFNADSLLKLQEELNSGCLLAVIGLVALAGLIGIIIWVIYWFI